MIEVFLNTLYMVWLSVLKLKASTLIGNSNCRWQTTCPLNRTRYYIMEVLYIAFFQVLFTFPIIFNEHLQSSLLAM